MKQPYLSIWALVVAAFLSSGCAVRHLLHQSQRQPDVLELPDAPAALRVQPGQVLTLMAKGSGVQIYVCAVDKNDSSRTLWMFKAPEAELLSAHGKTIGKHYAGPTWEGNDGSKVVGKLKASTPSADTSAIPWLLLTAASNSAASDSHPGVFGRTTAIQRLFTVGGKAPADGCDPAHLGGEARVRYSAQYYFYD